MVTFHIISLFPQSLDSYLNESILRRAQEDKKLRFKFYNPREYLPKAPKGKVIGKTGAKKLSYADRRVDDKPYGGGPGMVIEAQPVILAIAAAKKAAGTKAAKKTKIIFFSPSGEQFTNTTAKGIATKYTDIILVCGRYEGIDARVKKIFKMTDISVGPFVVTGGEIPAMLVIDVIARQVKGVLGNYASLEETRPASDDVYTRPEVFTYKKKNYRVPKVLLSGNHKLIEAWRAENRTRKAPKAAKGIDKSTPIV